MASKRRVTTTVLSPDHLIRLPATNSNPKRPGSAAHARFALLRDRMTVAEALTTQSRADLRWNIRRGFITLEKPTAPQAP